MTGFRNGKLRSMGISLLLAAMLPLGLGAREQAVPTQARTDDQFGVLVMAHGGITSWEQEVGAVLAPLDKEFPVQVDDGLAAPGHPHGCGWYRRRPAPAIPAYP